MLQPRDPSAVDVGGLGAVGGGHWAVGSKRHALQLLLHTNSTEAMPCRPADSIMYGRLCTFLLGNESEYMASRGIKLDLSDRLQRLDPSWRDFVTLEKRASRSVQQDPVYCR